MGPPDVSAQGEGGVQRGGGSPTKRQEGGPLLLGDVEEVQAVLAVTEEQVGALGVQLEPVDPAVVGHLKGHPGDTSLHPAPKGTAPAPPSEGARKRKEMTGPSRGAAKPRGVWPARVELLTVARIELLVRSWILTVCRSTRQASRRMSSPPDPRASETRTESRCLK